MGSSDDSIAQSYSDEDGYMLIAMLTFAFTFMDVLRSGMTGSYNGYTFRVFRLSMLFVIATNAFPPKVFHLYPACPHYHCCLFSG